MAEDFTGKLSGTDIKRFNKAVSGLDDVTGRQEEILKKVLASEIKIGDTRIAKLNEFFDIYSKSLDAIIARKTSELNDAFLILEKEASERLAAMAAAAKKDSADLSSDARRKHSNKPTETKEPPKTEEQKTESPTRSKAKEQPKKRKYSNKIEEVEEAPKAEKPKSKKPKSDSGKKESSVDSAETPKELQPSDKKSFVAAEGTTSGSEGSQPPPPPPPPPNDEDSGDGGNIPPDDGSVSVNNERPDEDYDRLNKPSDSDEGDSDTKKLLDSWTKFLQSSVEEQNNVIESQKAYLDAIDTQRKKSKEATLAELTKKEEHFKDSMMALYIARHQTEEDLENKLTEKRLASDQALVDAATKTQNYMNDLIADVTDPEYAADIRKNKDATEKETEKQKTLEQIEKKRLAFVEREELKIKQKNHGKITDLERKKIQEEAKKRQETDIKNIEELTKKRQRIEKTQAATEERKNIRELNHQIFNAETTSERWEALKKATTDENGEFDFKKSMTAALLAVSDFAKKLEGKIDEIGKYKGLIDTRLQGSEDNEKYMGSYWDQISRDMTSIGAVNPFFKQTDFAKNIESLVDKGIAFDLEQRAFLETIHEKIAKTFEVADGTLLRLIRIQQEDTTAGRLGMESALNTFLNKMYENTEYLTQVADTVRTSLQEMEALMGGAAATEVEFQIQKWLGSLYSVGMSQEAVQGIAQTLGQVAAGQIEGLTNGGASNLLVMAANEAGLSIADVLTNEVSTEDTNKLLEAAVKYLAELAESSKDNKVVQQQLANVFGVKASDLRAATNLVLPGTTNAIYNKSMSYSNMMNQLFSMAGTMGDRVSLGEQITNFWENGEYTLANGVASNPVTYFIYKMAKGLDDTVGGIDLPFVNVMGFGVDLNTTVSDLMRVAAMSGGILTSLGPIIEGLGNSFSGEKMLKELGLEDGDGPKQLDLGGRGGSLLNSGGGRTDTGRSGVMAANSSGSDIKDSTIQEANDSKKQQMIEAKEEAEENEVTIINTTVLKIYELLDDVVRGNSSLSVKVEGYGLTKANTASKLSSGAIGGIDGVVNNMSASLSNSSTSISGNFSGTDSSTGGINGSATSGGVRGSVDFGSWTAVI